MSTEGVPANWYPDPSGGGGMRYWDGTAWTPHTAPPPPPMQQMWGLAWKGAQLGRPQSGPGALTDPGRRLCARLLDGLVLLPVYAIVLTVTLLIAAPHFGPIFPTVYDNGTTTTSTATPGFLWLYLTVFACFLGTGIFMIAYETIATARYGRTLGKAWMHIRPLRRDGSPISAGRAFGRISMYWLFSFLSWVGLLDPLFCTWDDKRQCLHDKIADTIVVNDPTPG